MKAILKISLIFLLLLTVSKGYGENYVLFFKKTIPLQEKSPVNSFSYRVKLGEHLILILKKFGAKDKDIPYLLRIIKRLNPQIKDINTLYPGEIIYLPKVLKGILSSREKYPYVPFSYVVKRGDSVVRLLKVKGHIPTYLIFNEYLNLFKRLNPQLKNINKLTPGERIILPLRKGRQRISPLPSLTSYSPSRKKEVSLQKKNKRIASQKEKKSLSLALLSHIGFSVLTGEEVLYPTTSGEWISVDSNTSPIITSPWGEKFILIKTTSAIPSDLLTSLKKIGHLIYIASWDVRDVLRELSSQTKGRMLLWQEGKTLLIPCSDMVVESKAYLQIAIRKKTGGTFFYFIFSKKLSLSNYEGALVGEILKKNHIHIYLIKKGTLKEVGEEDVGLSHLYIPPFSSSPLASILPVPLICRYLSSGKNKKINQVNISSSFIRYYLCASLVLTFKTWKIEGRGDKEKIYLIDRRSPYIVALLRIRGYSAYLLPLCP